MSRSERAPAEQLQAVVQRLGVELEATVAQTVERQVTRRAGRTTRRVVELACGTLVAYVRFLLGRNFFYETPWLGKPLLGTGFLVQAVFWILAAALALRWALLRRLAQGRLAQVEDVPLGRLIKSDAGTFVPP